MKSRLSDLMLMNVWCCTYLSTLFKSYPDDGRVIMKGCVQWHTVIRWIGLPAGFETGISWSEAGNADHAATQMLQLTWFTLKKNDWFCESCASFLLYHFVLTSIWFALGGGGGWGHSVLQTHISSSVFLLILRSSVPLLPFCRRQHKMTFKGWHVTNPL